MSTNKPWERPWSMDEIIENSDNWNLAGDVALLNTLKSFADTLLRRTNEINNNLQNLTNNLDETSLQLNIAQNEFQNLRNSQFIESRVYEDDESLPQNEEKPRVEESGDHTEDIRLAAVKGLEVLEEYFDKVEVSVSDSEDEDINLPNYVLRPKDLYIDRPLPYVIGSDEWHKNWHVGLEDSSSDSETEKVSDQFSESDSESDLPIIQDRSQIKGTSDTSSELDFPQKIEPKLNKNDFFHSSDSENSVPAQGPISNKNFAEQLAAKLGHVITQEFEEPEINRRPILTNTSNYGDIFFDEPPPLDQPKGMFSGGGGLFDDDDDDLPSTPKDSKIETLKAKSGLFDDSDDDIFLNKNPQNPSKPPLFTDEPPAIDEKKKPVGGVSIFGGGNLFDKTMLRKRAPSDDEDEGKEEKEKKKVDLFSGDLFKSSPEKVSVGSSRVVKKVNLFDSDEDDGAKGLFDGKKNLEKIRKEEEKGDKPDRKISLFDDDDLFKEDLFSSKSTKKFTSGLFEDIPGDDLFSTNSEEKPKSRDLFDDLVAIPNKQSINNDSGKTNEKSTISEENDPFGSSPKIETGGAPERPPLPKPRLSLFDSPPPEPDDLFGTKTPEKISSDLFAQSPPKTTASSSPAPAFAKSPPKINFLSSDLFAESPKTAHITDLFAKSPPEIDSASSSPARSSNLFDESPPRTSSTPQVTPTPIPNLRLFDPSPPPDDDVDTKSDNLSENDDLINDFEDVKPEKADLFSEEPPSLDFWEETDARSKPKPGKLKHNLNINVGALMPGYVPPKRIDGAAKTSPDETSPDDVIKMADDNGGAVTSLDQPDKVEVLPSVTKDRAKVPLKRRPSTRRGRKEALRRSASDFQLEKDEEIENSPEKSKIEEKSEVLEEKVPPESGDLSGIQPEKDEVSKTATLFKENPLKGELEFPPDLGEVVAPTKSRSQATTNLFKENPLKGELEFPPDLGEVVEPTKSRSQPKSILFDDDDEDDLFSTRKTVQPTKTKKSLFDDDDDDDIFGNFGTANVKRVDTKMATEKKIPKTSSVKKLENTKPDDDPLSALLK